MGLITNSALADPLTSYIDAALSGLDFYSLANSTLCVQGFYHFADQIGKTNQTRNGTNVTVLHQTTLIGNGTNLIDDYLHIMSTSVSDIVTYCPVTLTDLTFNVTNQLFKFRGASLSQLIESFMFGLLSNSITFRDIFMTIESQNASAPTTPQAQVA